MRSFPVLVALTFALGFGTVYAARSQTAAIPGPTVYPKLVTGPTSAPSGRALPFPAVTPGRLRTEDLNNSCDTRTTTVRRVTGADKTAVRRAYGQPPSTGFYVYDHLVPLRLGGDTGRENLWPQPRAESRIKDRCEARAYSLVCDKGTLTLEDAQRGFQGDFWTFCASIGIQ